MKKKKIAVGLSGGVDSALSAHFLKEQGYDVTGVYLECWNEPGCRSDQDRKDALQIALDLHISFTVLDFTQAYKDKVVAYFFHEYKAGRTPNPDVMCNQEIKFGLFYDWAMEHGFSHIATGHYAQIIESSKVEFVMSSRYSLTTSSDLHKDQTYFLYRLQQEQLEHILFPIGHLTKHQVRKEARKRAISVADKKDSQGICFIGKVDVRKFIQQELGKNPGDVIFSDGTIIGTHQGLWFYTIGQRHGFTIVPKKSTLTSKWKHGLPPLYVVGKNKENNQLIVGEKHETKRKVFEVGNVHWIDQKMKNIHTQLEFSQNEGKEGKTTDHDSKLYYVKIRHTGNMVPAKLQCVHLNRTKNTECQILRVTCQKFLHGVAPGQSAVFYQKIAEGVYQCLGGGVIMGSTDSTSP